MIGGCIFVKKNMANKNLNTILLFFILCNIACSPLMVINNEDFNSKVEIQKKLPNLKIEINEFSLENAYGILTSKSNIESIGTSTNILSNLALSGSSSTVNAVVSHVPEINDTKIFINRDLKNNILNFGEDYKGSIEFKIVNYKINLKRKLGAKAVIVTLLTSIGIISLIQSPPTSAKEAVNGLIKALGFETAGFLLAPLIVQNKINASLEIEVEIKNKNGVPIYNTNVNSLYSQGYSALINSPGEYKRKVNLILLDDCMKKIKVKIQENYQNIINKL